MPLPKPKLGMTSQDLQKLADKAHEASDLLKALAHQTRLLILCILSEGEKTVGEIEDILGIQQAMVSQQLARLRLEGLVNTRREGRLVRACEQRGDEFHEPQDRHRVEEVEPDDLLGAADSRAAEETASCLALTD